jgi:hypothetical protein
MKKTQLLNALFVTLLLSLGSAVYATPIRQAQDLFRSAGTFTLDFNNLPVGARVYTLTLEQGISGSGISAALLNLSEHALHISGQRRNRQGDSNRAMTFDGECGGSASSCSGNDRDLFAPGQGNLLIVSQDNDEGNPNDNHQGGHIDIDFSDFGPGHVTVGSIAIFDVSHSGAAVELYAEGKRVERVPVRRGRTGEKTTVEFDAPVIDFMRIIVKDSFAIDDLSFTIE